MARDPRFHSATTGLNGLLNRSSIKIAAEHDERSNFRPGEFTAPRPECGPTTEWPFPGFSEPGPGVWSSRGKDLNRRWSS